jgi:serine/threonine protein kinase/tetratricopeptide (TPR) repeat protein
MTESNEKRLRRLFDLALAAAPDDRGPLLERLCRDDPGLRKRIEAMIAVAEDDRFLSEPTRGRADATGVVDDDSIGAETTAASIHEAAGTRIGTYKLLQLIGEGGFGSVFMAEQEKPIVRIVALKVIKLGMDTRQVIARFEAERQALALMDHPNIARVLDAGATETGRPFFVMELVKGDPIVEYCDKNGMAIADRLALFAQVCDAVQHAHTKGIIHRDIKPSNILVSTQDGRPHAKVIDFGIAKATASKLTEKTIFTEYKALIGTPEYMSPEQAEGSLDIDTRTDVYSLGVLLYELLTGTTPFTSKELRSAAHAEIQRIIREVDPPKPSTRLSANSETIVKVAARRHTEPKRLGTIVRGELDWIVMKALEKDRQRRYETASGLAMDIRRYLCGEAVAAAAPSAAYRIKKSVMRNKGPVLAGGAVAAALVIGMVAFAWQASVARAQRDIAVAAQWAEAEQRAAAEAARAEALSQQARAEAQAAEAKTQAAIAEAVARFQTDMLSAADPENLLGDRVTVVQVMQAAGGELDSGALEGQPRVESGVRNAIGQTLCALSRYEDAEPHLRKSLEIRRATLPAGHPDIATAMNNLAELLRAQNRLDEAEPLHREALEIRRASLPARHLDIAESLSNIALILRVHNRLAEAEPLFREALEIRRELLPAWHLDTLQGLYNLTLILRTQNRLAEVEPHFREALEIARSSLPAGHPRLAGVLYKLARILEQQSKFADAELLYRESLEIARAAYPANHPMPAQVLNNLAIVLRARGNLAEAEQLYRESLAIRRRILPADHPSIAQSLNNLAVLLRARKEFAEAESLQREALRLARAALPADHPGIALGLTNLASLLEDQHKFAEAEPLYHEALAIRRASPSPGHAKIAASLNDLASVQHKLGRAAEARAGWDEAIAILREESPDGSALLARVLLRSGLARLDEGHAAALPELEEAKAMADNWLPPDDPDLKEFRAALTQYRKAMDS